MVVQTSSDARPRRRNVGGVTKRLWCAAKKFVNSGAPAAPILNHSLLNTREELMHIRKRLGGVVLAMLSFVAATAAQTHGQSERFTAVAVQNSVLGSGAGTVLISIDRWSTNAERETLV